MPPFTFALKNDAIADDAGIEPQKIIGLLGMASLAGKTYYVQSTHARAGSTLQNGTKAAPFATLKYAVTNLPSGLLTNATFVLLPGHTETLSAVNGADLDIDAAGVTVIGVGTGSYQPTIKLSAVTTSRINVSGANVTLYNLRIECDLTGNTHVDALYVTGADCTIDSCFLTEGTTTEQSDNYIRLTTGANNAIVRNCEIMSVTAGSEAGIIIATTLNRVQVVKNWIHGNFSNAPVYSASVHTHCLIDDNRIQQLTTAVPIRFTAAATGFIVNNRCSIAANLANRATNAGLDIGSCYACENYVADNEADTNALLTPAAQAT